MANITDHRGGKSWPALSRTAERKGKFCVTELSSISLLVGVMGVSASLWLAIVAVVV